MPWISRPRIASFASRPSHCGSPCSPVPAIVRRARRHPYVGKVFREGLTAIRNEILASDPDALPGAASNQCFFCWWVLTRGLAAGVPGGGGQVGAWTGERPSAAGELIQLGMASRRVGPAGSGR